MLAHSSRIDAGSEPRHVVQFYEDAGVLIDRLARFVDAALGAGDGLLVVATRAHLEALSSRVGGPALREAVDAGSAALLDADATLGDLMVDGVPAVHRFTRSIESTVRRCGLAVQGGLTSEAPRRRVRAFGEMVDILCRDGRAGAAIRLETLWNDILDEQHLSMLCGYSMASFSGHEDAEYFGQVCAQHDRVIPAEPFVEGEVPGVRDREIAMLQQQARALTSEVDKRKELEQALRVCVRERRRAEHTSRIRDELLATVSRELRLPVKAIAGWSSLLRSEQDIDLLEAADTIEFSARTQTQLLDDLTDASRVVGGTLRIRPGPVDLAFLLRSSVEGVLHAAKTKGITIDLEIESDPCLGHADPHRIEQVLSNLLSNAVQFTQEGGRVIARLMRNEDEVEFSVRDHGSGISASALPFIFDRLQRVDDGVARQPRGMQLGLAVARHLVELHGGSITARSEGPGLGATFTVRLPRRAT